MNAERADFGYRSATVDPIALPSPRDALRAATRRAHARVDAQFADGLRTPDDYRVYLRGMHAFAGAVERAIAAQFSPAWRAWRSPRRVADLAADLAALSAAPLLPPPPAPDAAQAAQAAGLLYVIEGSALGARLLLRDAARLGFDGARGAAFLQAHARGEEGTRWPRFLAMLAEQDFDSAARDVLQRAANDAFDLAHACFARAAAHDMTGQEPRCA